MFLRFLLKYTMKFLELRLTEMACNVFAFFFLKKKKTNVRWRSQELRLTTVAYIVVAFSFITYDNVFKNRI